MNDLENFIKHMLDGLTEKELHHMHMITYEKYCNRIAYNAKAGKYPALEESEKRLIENPEGGIANVIMMYHRRINANKHMYSIVVAKTMIEQYRNSLTKS